MFCLPILISSCKKQYKLKVDDSVPGYIAALITNKTYTEGRNVMIEEKGWKVLVDIKNGQVENVWYQDDGVGLIIIDSLHTIAKDKKPGPGGGQGGNPIYCNNIYLNCLYSCPYLPITNPITGEVVDEYIDPVCYDKCWNEYTNCLKRISSLKKSIEVIL